jgi:hypothetical protein
MIGQRHCPLCNEPALVYCRHLALAVEAREFIPRCVEKCQGERLWQTLCETRRAELRRQGEWSPEQEDFTWLETAFCHEFLRRMRWFGGIDYEWRSGPRLDQGGFWVLLWSKDPQRLWWELRDEFERRCGPAHAPSDPSPAPWLLLPPTAPESTRRQSV